MPALIQLENVQFSYPTAPEKRVIQGINLQVNEGEFVALVGANGSGKSTLLRLIAGLLYPTQGEVRIDGHPTSLASHQAALHTTLGMVFQYPEDQVVGATVEEDIAFGLENLGWQPALIRQRVDEMLFSLDLEDQRNRPSHLLSAGQTQRLALAGVLAPRPRLLLFDEATTMLDPRGRKELMLTLKRLHAEGITIVMVTHHMDEAAQADRVVVIHHGSIALDSAPQAVFSNLGILKQCGLTMPAYLQLASILQPYLQEQLPPINSLEELLQHLGQQPVPKGSNPEAYQPCQPVSSAPVISVNHLVHRYQGEEGQNNITLQDVSLQVQAGLFSQPFRCNRFWQVHLDAEHYGVGKAAARQHSDWQCGCNRSANQHARHPATGRYGLSKP